MKKQATAAERRYMDKVSKLRCVICGDRSECLHHVREGQGMGQRAQHYLVIPLCNDCHTGTHGIHGDRSRWKIFKMDELDALAMVIMSLQT